MTYNSLYDFFAKVTRTDHIPQTLRLAFKAYNRYWCELVSPVAPVGKTRESRLAQYTRLQGNNLLRLHKSRKLQPRPDCELDGFT